MRARIVDAFADKTKEVRVRVTVPRVHEINMQEHCFTAEIKMEASWIDSDPIWADVATFLAAVYPSDRSPLKRVEGAVWFKQPITSNYFELLPERFGRLLKLHKNSLEALPAHTYAKLKNLPRVLGEKRFFAPRLVLSNMVNGRNAEMWYSLRPANEAHGGQVLVAFNWLVTGIFQHAFELSDFPFDEQDLLIELRTGYEEQHAKSPVTLVRNQSAKSVAVTRGFAQMSEYHLYQHVQFTPGTTEGAESASGARYATLQMKLHIKRKYGYWVWNVILPMAIVTSTLFSTFALPFEETNDRLASSLTILLAMVAFKTFTAEKLPKIAYLSFIDKYVLSSFLVALVVVFTHVLLRSLASSEDEVTWTPGAARLSMLMVGGLGLWLVCHVATVVYIIQLYRRRRRDDPFWAGGTNKALWIGPLHKDYRSLLPRSVQQPERAEYAAEEMIRAVLVEFVKSLHRERGGRTRATSLPVGLQEAAGHESLPADVRVTVWDAADAKKHLETFREKYPFRESFAIVEFATEEVASIVVEKAREAGGRESILGRLVPPHGKLSEIGSSMISAAASSPRLSGRRLSGRSSVPLEAASDADELPAIFARACTLEPLNPAWFALSHSERGSMPPWLHKSKRAGSRSLKRLVEGAGSANQTQALLARPAAGRASSGISMSGHV